MPYVDVADIQEHLRIGNRVQPAQITELMTEVESYVKMHLNTDPLPPDNDVLKSIVRELTMARVILDALPATSDDLARAQMHQSLGARLLTEVKDEGLTPNNVGSRDVSKEVYNPDPSPFFTVEDFM